MTSKNDQPSADNAEMANSDKATEPTEKQLASEQVDSSTVETTNGSNPSEKATSEESGAPSKTVNKQTKKKTSSAKPKKAVPPPHPVAKWVSRLVMTLAVIPIILFLAFWGAVSFMDFNQYKPQIEKEFLAKTGHELKIEGDIDVSVIPFVMEAQQVRLKNQPSFNAADLASLESVQVELSLWELFVHRRLEMLGVEVEKAELFLHTKASGETNWQALQRLVSSKKALPEVAWTIEDLRNPAYYRHTSQVDALVSESTLTAVPDAFDSSEAASSLRWRLDSFVSQNAQLHWKDEQSEHHFTIEDFDLLAFDIAPNQAFKVVTNFIYESNVNHTRFHTNLSADLTLSQRLDVWQMKDWLGNVRMVLPAEMKIPEVRVETSGQLLRLDFKRRLVEAEALHMSSLKGHVNASFNGRFDRHPMSKGHLKADHIDIRKWLRHSGIPYPQFVNKMVLTNAAVELDWQQTEQDLAIENLDLQWDDSKLTGRIWRKKEASTDAAYHFDLQLDGIDLDKYQAVAKREELARIQGASSEATGKKAPNKVPDNAQVSGRLPSQEDAKLNQTYLPLALPVSTLRSMNTEGRLRIGKLKAWEMKFANFDMNLSAKGGKLALAPLDADLYDGSLTSKLKIDVSGKTPAYQWSGKVAGVDLLPFLRDGWDYRLLEGKYHGHFNLATRGVNSFLLKQNMNGAFTARIVQGQFNGMDMNKLLAGKGTSPKDSTKIDSMSMDGKIRKGVYQIRRFNAKSERFSAIGTGRLVLTNALLDATIHTTYNKPPKGIEALKGVEVPVFVKGPLGKAKWTVNLDGFLQNPDNQKKLIESLKLLWK